MRIDATDTEQTQTTVSPKQLDPSSGLPPPERERDWNQLHEEPILDTARMPLREFRANNPTHSAVAMYIWLRVLRPLLLVVFWVAVAIYAWRHFFEPTGAMGDSSLLMFYAALVSLILITMLVMAPVRQRVHADEDSNLQPLDDTAPGVAKYADLGTRRLLDWRQARRLTVEHDDEGRMTDAASLDDGTSVLEKKRRKA